MSEEYKSIGVGMAIAAGICASMGDEVCAEEILGAGNLDTEAKLRECGVDDYDIDLLRSVIEHIAYKAEGRRLRREKAAPAFQQRGTT